MKNGKKYKQVQKHIGKLKTIKEEEGIIKTNENKNTTFKIYGTLTFQGYGTQQKLF